MRFKMTVLGVEQVNYELTRFAEGIENFKPLFQDLLRSYKEIEEEQFDTEGGRMGDKWEDLSPGYASYKSTVRPGRPILVFDGDMRAAVLEPKVDMDKRRMTLTVEDEKFGYHQEGTPKMPARPVVRLTDHDLDTWRQLTHRFLYDQSKKTDLKVKI